MGIAKQLYQLQELDLEIESNAHSLGQKSAQLGERAALDAVQTKLTEEKQRLSELKHRQRSTEVEADDFTAKIKAAEEQLYSGRTSNPKELTSLQQDINMLKSNRNHLETKELEIMEQVELAETRAAALSADFKRLENEWQRQQQQLSAEVEQLKSKIADLQGKRKLLQESIPAGAIAIYEKLRKQKGQALARVEQGICQGCRISLSFSELQQVKGDKLVQCSSCGRILFLP